ncbi:MAG: PhoX family protein, partial [Pseudomonadales bacterium]|nr:PhoX family protein [Pseudomonadales bacterium]
WTASDFDDSGWSTGAAELGFTEGDENTVITSGSLVYYFRHKFTVADISDITALCMKVQRDDGCVIYLNGTEVNRSINMPDGAVTYQTASGDAMSESTSFMYDVALDGLVAGENVVAVSVHQSSAGSSDVSFDPEFIASRTTTSENVLAVEVHQVSATSSDVSFDAELVATTSGKNVLAVEVHQNQTASSDISFDAGLTATTIARSDLSAGTLEAAVVDGDNNVTWGAIDDPEMSNGVHTRYQYGPATSFNGGEGLDYHDRSMYFTTKNDNRVYQYDIDNETMTIIYDQTTDLNGGLASGLDNLEMSPQGDVIIAEDGGNMELVAIANDYVVPICRIIGHSSSEMTGPAFTSDMTRLYVSSQRGSTGDSADGVTYEISGPFTE